MKEWYHLVDSLTPSIVKIETQDGYGTGFLCSYNFDGNFAAIATAYHVIEHAD
jgi:hypothetical protein